MYNKNLDFVFKQKDYKKLNYRKKFAIHCIAITIDFLEETGLKEKSIKEIYKYITKSLDNERK